jgi:hypothetical protein
MFYPPFTSQYKRYKPLQAAFGAQLCPYAGGGQETVLNPNRRAPGSDTP